MASYPHNLKCYLSGGAANTDPSLSIGGAISSTHILSQSVTASTIAAVTYDDAGACVQGEAQIRFTLATNQLDFMAPTRAVWGPPVSVVSDGTYTLRSDDLIGYVVAVKSGTLPTGNTTQNVTIGQQMNKLFDDTSKAESLVGRTEYRCMMVKNTSGSDAMSTVTMWVDTEPVGQDTVWLGLDPLGKNSTPGTLANDTTAPSNVSFYTALGQANALSLGTLNPGDYYPVWIKRVVPATVDEITLNDASQVRFIFL